MNITILGAGAWGTALAVHAVAAHPTRLWARDAEQVKRMRSSRRNASYLPEVVLPPALQVGNDIDSALGYAAGGIVVIATPAAARAAARAPPSASLDATVLWLCKGFQEGTGALGHEIARALRPSSMPSAIPVAIASTFLTAPPTSTPTGSADV